MYMPEDPEQLKDWIAETAAIAQQRIYITDDGMVKCGDHNCRCDGIAFGTQMPGRRHILECLVAAIIKHRREWGNPELSTPDTTERQRIECCRNTA